MPFAVFRQHQRKLLAVFAIMAMIGFVLSDTLPRWMNSGGASAQDLEVAKLYGQKIHLSDLALMNQKRQRANRFMYYADRLTPSSSNTKPTDWEFPTPPPSPATGSTSRPAAP
jgi:hypothetical protein